MTTCAFQSCADLFENDVVPRPIRSNPESYSEPCQTSKDGESFEKILMVFRHLSMYNHLVDTRR